MEGKINKVMIGRRQSWDLNSWDSEYALLNSIENCFDKGTGLKSWLCHGGRLIAVLIVMTAVLKLKKKKPPFCIRDRLNTSHVEKEVII